MYEKLRNYIESLFEAAPNTQQAVEIKEEIIQNTTQRYNDLLAEGKSEEAAFNIAVAGIGDVSDLLNTLRANSATSYNGYTKEEIQRDRQRSGAITAIAVMLYICSLIPPILLDGFRFGWDLGPCIMFLMIAIATALLIYNAKTRIHYQKKDDTMVENFKQWNTESKRKNSLYGSIASAIWAIGLVLYFVISFSTGAWYITWVIFIITVAVQNIAKAILEVVEK